MQNGNSFVISLCLCQFNLVLLVNSLGPGNLCRQQVVIEVNQAIADFNRLAIIDINLSDDAVDFRSHLGRAREIEGADKRCGWFRRATDDCCCGYQHGWWPSRL